MYEVLHKIYHFRFINLSKNYQRFIIQMINLVVVGCCKLNKTRDCDEHLLRQISAHTGRYQLPIFRCTIIATS